MTRELHLALIAGPQYDGLLTCLPAFEQRTGYRLQVEVRLPHVELNARMAQDLGTERGRYDLISTHTKYCPSQAQHLLPLDELVSAEALAQYLTSAEVQRHEASVGGHTPVRASLFASLKAAQSGRDAQRLAALEETINHYAMIPPKFARYPLAEDILWVGVQSAILGERTPRQALVWMEQQVEEALQ